MKRKENQTALKKRWCIAIAAALLLLLAAPFLVSGYVCLSSAERIVTPETAASLDADCILVPGALVHENGRLSSILADRMLVGIDAYASGVSDRLLLSGDHGRVDYDEVTAMKNYAVSKGVPENVIFLDHAGFSTYESLYRARDVFGAEKIVIVTQRYHLFRALYIAKRLGLSAYGVSSDLSTYSGQTRFELREIAARNKDFLLSMLQLPPAMQGDPIPLDGDGRVTQAGN